jgi:hypothetical protein
MRHPAALGLCALLCVAPAKSGSFEDSVTAYCVGAKRLNHQGISVAPGSAMAQQTIATTGLSASRYEELWRIAQRYNISACRSIW